MTIDILLVENSMFSVYGRLKTCIQQIKETYDLGDVHQVGDLKSALNQLGKSRRIGLVFCDTQFGGALNGPDIAKAINEAYNNLPIVGISVNPDHKPLWEPYDFVLKRDFNTNYLREILDKHK